MTKTEKNSMTSMPDRDEQRKELIQQSKPQSSEAQVAKLLRGVVSSLESGHYELQADKEWVAVEYDVENPGLIRFRCNLTLRTKT